MSVELVVDAEEVEARRHVALEYAIDAAKAGVLPLDLFEAASAINAWLATGEWPEV